MEEEFIKSLLLSGDSECFGKKYSENEELCKICGQTSACKYAGIDIKLGIEGVEN